MAKTGAKIRIGEHMKEVQKIFNPVFNATDLKTDGSNVDHHLVDDETFPRLPPHRRPYSASVTRPFGSNEKAKRD